MIGIDTNVLVRYVMQDDPAQTAAATHLLNSLTPQKPGFIALVAIAELGWVLNRQYKFDRKNFALVLGRLLDSSEVIVEANPQVAQALLLFETTKADFGDCLISQSASDAGCEWTVSFDRMAAKRLGMQILS